MDILRVAIDSILVNVMTQGAILFHSMVRHAAVAVSVQAIHGMHTVDGIYSVHTVTADVA